MDNQEGPTIAHGPGRVCHLAPGTLDAPAAAPSPGAAPAPKEPPVLVMKLTRIDFEGRMFSTSTKGKDRAAKFYDNVEVHHIVANSPDAPVNPDRPGKNGFYLRCDLLSVYKHVEQDRTVQSMEAHRNVFFRAEEFFGRADCVKYDQDQDQIVFEGSPGNPATLWKFRQPGDPQEIKGAKILYNRRTGEFHLEGGKVLQSWLDRNPPATEQSGNSFLFARLHLDRQDEPLALLRLVPRDDR
jgi:lipopolysaccharide export system protein LptA